MRRAPRTAAPRQDGLVGLTRRQQEIIDARIERVRAAKRVAHGRDIPPSIVILALDGRRVGVAADAPDPGERKCAGACQRRLPPSEFYFNARRGAYNSYCHDCERLRTARYRRSQAGRAAARRKAEDPSWRARRIEQNREYRRRRREQGIGCEAVTPRRRLVKCLYQSRRRLGRMTDPAARAKTEAHIAGLIREIERIDRGADE